MSRSTPSRPARRAPSRRPGRRRRRTPVWRRILLWLAGLALLGAVALTAVFATAYARTEIPEPNDFAEAQSTILYYADGETELARFTGGYDREVVTLAEIPEHVQHAVLAAADRSFYEN